MKKWKKKWRKRERNRKRLKEENTREIHRLETRDREVRKSSDQRNEEGH